MPASVEIYQNFAALAFIPLGVLAAVSFLFVLKELRWWRLAVLVPFAVLGAFWARAIPFFAVVAAPIAALNFQDFAARLAARPKREAITLRPWGLVGRVATVLLLAILLGLAWPGLLHPRSDDFRYSRRVSWGMLPNDSFRQAAEVLTDLRSRGVLTPESHAFNLTPEAAAYCAWFCPEEKCYFDLRLSHFSDKVAGDYVKARRDLEFRVSKSEEAVAAGKPVHDRKPDTLWPPIFRDKSHRIDHVIFTMPEWIGARNVIGMRFWRDSGQWTMLYGDGRTFVFGWNDPRQGARGKFLDHGVNLPVAAFTGEAEPAAREDTDDDDRKELRETAPERSWWELGWQWYTHGPAPRPLEVDRAGMLFDYYVAREQGEQRERVLRQMEAQFAQMLSAESMGAGMEAVGGQLAAFTSKIVALHVPFYEEGPPPPELSAAALLCARAANQAIRKRPDDAQAHFRLARAIGLLGRREGALLAQAIPPGLPPPPFLRNLDEIRQVQMVNALSRAVRARPDYPEARLLLAEMFLKIQMIDPSGQPFPSHVDMYLNNLHEGLKLQHKELDNSRESEEGVRAAHKALDKMFHDRLLKMIALKRRMKQLSGSSFTDEEYKTPEEFLSRLKAAYSLKAENQPPLVRVRLAFEFGLAEEAQSILENLDPQTPISPAEANYLVLVLIKSGHADQGVELKQFNKVADSWVSILLAMAQGDYNRADEYLALRMNNAQKDQLERILVLAGYAPRDSSPRPDLQRYDGFTLAEVHPRVLQLMSDLPYLKASECNLRALRGLVALERGDAAAAEKHFTAALRPTQPPAKPDANAPRTPRFQFELAPLARAYLTEITGAQQAARAKK
jgi:hypothetical protein